MTNAASRLLVGVARKTMDPRKNNAPKQRSVTRRLNHRKCRPAQHDARAGPPLGGTGHCAYKMSSCDGASLRGGRADAIRTDDHQ